MLLKKEIFAPNSEKALINELVFSNQNKPTPVSVSIGFILAHEEYKKTLEKIVHITSPNRKLSEEEKEKTLINITELAKKAIVEAELYNMKY